MARRFGELAIAVAIASAFGCGEDSDDPSADTGDGTTTDGPAIGTTGPGTEDDGDSADDADSTGTPTECGNGVVEEGEVCDDGEANGTYGQCTAACDGVTSCGDGDVQEEAGEVCDYGQANGAYGYCMRDCSGLGSRCGDEIVDERHETCDDGNEIVGDGCNTFCELGGQELMFRDEYAGGESAARDIGVLPDGRHYIAGWATLESRPLFMAFDMDVGPPLFMHTSPADGGGFASAVSMPDGRVLVTGGGIDGLNQQVALRSWYDLDARAEVEIANITGGGYALRAAPLPGGGHVACNAAVSLGLQYYGDPDAPSFATWENTANDCNVIAADPSVVVQAWVDVHPTGPWAISILAFLHSGLPKWSDEFYLGVGSASVDGIAIDDAGNVAVAGSFESQGGELRPMLRKYDEDGELQWATGAQFTSHSQWGDVAFDALGNVVVAGYERITVDLGGSSIEIPRPVIRKYSPDGDVIWTWQREEWDEDTPWEAELEAVAVAPDGSILAAGFLALHDGDRNVLRVRISP